MRKIISTVISLVMAAMMLPVMPVMADEGDTGAGEVYTAPESHAITYNMNLDWKFKDTQKYMSCPVQEA